MVNLLGNAVKFTPEGAVTLSVSLALEPALVRVTVEDTGIGISREAQERIFDHFAQGDESMTRRYGGTGLGLAIAKQLTELMGGVMELSSEPGEGSSFSFTVALEPHQNAPRPERSYSALRSKRALLASDDPELRETLLELTGGLGMDLDCVADAPGALRRLLAAPFDLVLMDHCVAGTDGLALAATIRSIAAGHSVRLVLLAEEPEAAPAERVREIEVALLRRTNLTQEGLYAALVSALGMEEEQGGGEDARSLRRLRQVLLVEDNVVNQEVGRGMLESLGCQVKVAENGLAALKEVQRGGFDLVFMDCQMPVLDGLEATRRIRQLEEGSSSRVPIIALTAYALKGDREACLAAGADDYLSKPFSREQLSKSIERRLGCGQARSTQAPQAGIPAEIICPGRAGGALELIRTLPGHRGVEILRKVVDLYLASTPTLLQTLREAESGGDAEKLKAAAHSFKSSSANLGAVRLAGVCLELESLGRAGSTEGAGALLVQVEEEYRLVRDALLGGPLC
jgi:CheY-like chemotaxis protein